MKAEDKEEIQKSYVYMVMCKDDSIYTGITKDIKGRMREHYFKTGKGAKYTRSRHVQRILMVWEAKSYASAARLEYAIKRMTHKNKVALIQNPTTGIPLHFPKLAGETYIPRPEYVMDIACLLEDKIIDKEEGI